MNCLHKKIHIQKIILFLIYGSRFITTRSLCFMSAYVSYSYLSLEFSGCITELMQPIMGAFFSESSKKILDKFPYRLPLVYL